MIITRLRRPMERHPFVPSDPAARDTRCRETFLIQSTALARRLEALPKSSRRIILGVSGGQDSTHALLVAVHAVDRLGLPRKNIIAVTMPGFGTTKQTAKNAVALARAVGATVLRIPIKKLSAAMFDAVNFQPKNNGTREDVLYENVQAWMRKMVLFSVACRDHGIDLGTGDMSELALGWCTYGGDHMSHYNVNGGVPKTLISFLIGWAREEVFKEEPDVQRVLLDILNTAISPELQPAGRRGEITQKTEDILGPYELHDFFLYHFVRFGASIGKIALLALQAFEGKYTMTDIKRHLGTFIERFFANQFKRDCVPDGPKVGLVTLSPRGDWRMPADMSPTLWLGEVAKLPTDVTLFD